ncbi:organic solute transporter subunit alpha-like [Patiria miniata]|uniref:Uncharacterized protein n=1 Tax=Patiria miniata TaxID=46514 RepID=A0A914BA74_PATMI|nr:organic solute transporter subunit alpha-like [Patiria miniata]
MGAMLGINIEDCTQNGTIDFTQGSLTAGKDAPPLNGISLEGRYSVIIFFSLTELAKYPLFTLLFSYASLASFTVIVIFFEAAFFTATRVPRSAVANHRINTVVMMSAFPVFVVCCLPALLIPSSAAFCLALVDLYYAFVMFKFVVLQVDYYGGHRKMMARLAANKVMFNINVPLLCCFCCLKPVRLTRWSFIVIKILVLQVAIIRPVVTFFMAIASFAKLSLVGIPSLILQLAVSVPSTMTAITGMNMLTRASISKDLEKYELPAKARLMTAGLMIIGFQPLIIMIANWWRPLGCILPFPSSMLTDQWQSFILIIESTLLMIPILRYYRTADGNVVGVPPPIEEEEEEASTGLGKMRQWIRRHTLM